MNATLVRRIIFGISAALIAGFTGPMLASDSQAVTLQNLSVAYKGIIAGNFSSTGNSVLTCSTTVGTYASDCQAARKRQGSHLNNDDFTMTNIKVPFGSLNSADYFNSSQGVVVVPTGSVIVHATLFWGGSMRINAGDSPAVDSTKKNQVLFARSDQNCITASDGCAVTALSEDVYQVNSATNLGPYRASADVTAKLNSADLAWTVSGPHQSLTLGVANIQTVTGRDKSAGWGLMVVYRNPNAEPRAITIYKGFAQESLVEDDAFIFDGFRTATTGNVHADFGLVAFDGDAANQTDSISLVDAKGSAMIADSINPDNNMANSTISTSGIHSPYLNNSSLSRSRNTFGIDVDQISMENSLSNDVTSATVYPSVSGDTFYISGLALSVEIKSPDLVLTKFISVLSGADPNAVSAGDTVEYTIEAKNLGQATASSVEVSDVIPSDLVVTSSSGSDCASLTAGVICKSLGTIEAGEAKTFTIQGQVTGDSATNPGYFDNQVTGEFTGPFGPQTAYSDSVRLTYGAFQADLSSDINFVKDFIQAGQTATLTAGVTNLGPAPDSNPSLKIVAQSGAKLSLVSVPSGCLVSSSSTLTCDAASLGITSVNPLAPGERASITLKFRPARKTSILKVWSTAITGVSGGDTNSENDVAETTLFVNHKPVALPAKLNAQQDGPKVSISMATRISDVDGDSIHIKLGKVAHGSAIVKGSLVTYTPPKNWYGYFRLTYVANDGKGGLARSYLLVHVSKKDSGSSGHYCFVTGC